MYKEIARNKTITILILLGFVLFIVALFYFYFTYYDYSGVGLILGLCFSVPAAMIGYYTSDKAVLLMAGAHEVSRRDNKQLYELVDNLAITAGLPKPKIFVIDDEAMNAFATGRDPNHAVIAFTSGLLKNLSKVEIEGVAAHEMSHIKNFDTRLSTVLIIFVGLIGMMAEWFWRLGRIDGRGSKSKNDNGSGILAIFGLIFIILSPLIAQIIQLALSRNREYLADADAALLTRYPEGLIGALEKLSNQVSILSHQSSTMNHMYITDPVKSFSGAGGGWWSNLFSTHPPVEERIKRLKNMMNV